jgi:hypothetical protein
MDGPQTTPNTPIMPVPERIWAAYSTVEWYAWARVRGVMYDLMVYPFLNGWTWAIDSAADGSRVSCASWATEGNRYPNASDAMTACENYFRRAIDNA